MLRFTEFKVSYKVLSVLTIYQPAKHTNILRSFNESNITSTDIQPIGSIADIIGFMSFCIQRIAFHVDIPVSLRKKPENAHHLTN